MSTSRFDKFKTHLPDWVQDWLDIIVPGAQILLIIGAAWLLQRLLRKLVTRAARHYNLPHAMLMTMNGLIRWSIVLSALLLVLERLGVSATVLWSAFTGFATVGAVAFFAAWSVLSNFFCALLIMMVRPYRLGDTIEVLEALDKVGVKGRVVDINMLYTTLEERNTPEDGRSLIQIPNVFVFQKGLRRWTNLPQPAAATPQAAPPTANPSPINP